MARIRSIHPGFFKDEQLVPCSAFARLLFIGLGIEADDKGIFEWKPLTIKMSIFPGDNVDIPELLAELVEANAVMRFVHDGKPYGAIRNFRKFQRPKTPNDLYPMPDDVASYVGFPKTSEMTGDEAPPLENHFRNAGEKSPQMEDGGDKMEEEGGNKEEVLPPLPREADRETVVEALEAYNGLAAELSLPTITKFSANRRSKLAARLRDCGGIAGWKAALAKIRGSPFCLGDNDRGWKADFDFLLQEQSFIRLMEGRYDDRGTGNRRAQPKSSRSQNFAVLDALVAEAERREAEESGGDSQGAAIVAA